MGLLHKIISAGPAFSRMGKAFDECLQNIALCRITHNVDNLYKAAWIYFYGIQGSLEKWNWQSLRAKILIPNYIEIGRITLNQAILLTLKQIYDLAAILQVESIVTDIIKGGIMYQEKSYLISQYTKDKIRP